MAAMRSWGSVVVTLCLASWGWAQSYSLVETPKADEYFRIHLDMTVAGEIRVCKESTQVPLKLKASATHEFPERLLVVGPTGLPQKSARFYEAAKAQVTVDGGANERALRPERRLQVAQRYKDQLAVYCPAGPLTRSELQLTSEHLDTLALTGLLPGKEVKVGETWKLAPAVAQSMCGFEGLTTQDVTCKLDDVKDNVATVSIKGAAVGIDLGALCKLTIQGSYRYDLTAHRLTVVEWTQKDDRDQGPASPSTAVETTTKLTRTVIEPVDTLSDGALVSVPEGLDLPSSLTQLVEHDAKDRYELTYEREWQTVGHTEDHLVLRLLDRGDFVAQASVTPWPKLAPGKHATPEEFQQAMARTPGWEQEEVLQAGEVPSEERLGRWVYRIAAVGSMDGLKVVQNFYLAVGSEGDQVVIAFMMTPTQVAKLNTRDINLVSGLVLPKKK